MIPIQNRKFNNLIKNTPQRLNQLSSAINEPMKPVSTPKIFHASNILNSKKKICQYLDENPNSKVLFIFDHGLGDIIMFLNLLENIKLKYPNVIFEVGLNENLQLDTISPHITSLKPIKSLNWNETYYSKLENRYNLTSLQENFKYDFIFEISFPENMNKSQTCAIREFGFKYPLNYDLLKLYDGSILEKNESRTVGLHFTSNSGIKHKSLTVEQSQLLFSIVKKLGYTPIVFDSNFKSKNPAAILNNDWIPPKNRIDPNLNINDIMYVISKCRYVIGITSGIICLAKNILGDDRCVHLNKWGPRISHWLPTEMVDLWPISENKLQVILE